MDLTALLVLLGAAAAALAVALHVMTKHTQDERKLRKLWSTDASADAVKLPFASYANMPSRVLVTGGATSFMGRHIVEALVLGGVKVVSFDERRSVDEDDRVTYIVGSLMDRDALDKALDDHDVDAVFHTVSARSSVTHAKTIENINVIGTRTLLSACKAQGVRRLVFTSTAEVVIPPNSSAAGIAEDAEPWARSSNPHVSSMATAEAEVIKMGLEAASDPLRVRTCVIRAMGVFGPREPEMIPDMLSRARRHAFTATVGSGGNDRDCTYVGNVVHAHMLAMGHLDRRNGNDKANAAVFHVSNDAPMPFWQFWSAMLVAFGYPAPSRRVPPALASFFFSGKSGYFTTARGKRDAVTSHTLSISNAKSVLGYKPLWSVAQGINATVRSFEDHRSADAPDNGKGLPGGTGEAAELRPITAEEVAGHNTGDDVWIIIKNKVYDVTPYVNKHPGGDKILLHAGGDATTGFYGPQHPDHVYDTITQFQIGTLAPSRTVTAAEVAKHNTRDDAWIIVDGNAYDVTAFVDKHPGGDAVLNNVGGDATAGFHGPQHNGTPAAEGLAKFLVGKVAS